jgi:hypothetical protein
MSEKIDNEKFADNSEQVIDINEQTVPKVSKVIFDEEKGAVTLVLASEKGRVKNEGLFFLKYGFNIILLGAIII